MNIRNVYLIVSIVIMAINPVMAERYYRSENTRHGYNRQPIREVKPERFVDQVMRRNHERRLHNENLDVQRQYLNEYRRSNRARESRY